MPNLDVESEIHHFRRARRNKYLQRVVLATVFALLLLLISFMISQERKTLLEYRETSARLENELSLIDSSLSAGDLSGTLRQVKLIAGDIKSLKLLAQSWGQDRNIFNFLQKKSEFGRKETLLDSAYDIVAASEELENGIAELNSKNVLGSAGGEYLLKVDELGGAFQTSIEKLRKTLVSVELALSGDNSKEAKSLKSKVETINSKIDYYGTFLGSDLSWLDGTDGQEKKILVIFQNNSELRGGSGGSFGSFGIANLKDGKLEKITFGQNIYKIDNPYRDSDKTKIEPPYGVNFVSPKQWVMKDAGWSVDGSEALSKIREFYFMETGEKVDGVVTLDYSAFAKILRLVGPIEMPAYNLTLTADNFKNQIEEEVHVDYFNSGVGKTENEPKKILGDMMPVVMNKVIAMLKSKDHSADLLAAIVSSLGEKDILLNFDNASLQQKIESLNYAGKITKTAGDYISVNNSNVDGAKSSLNMKETVNIKVDIDDKGRITNSLDLIREHAGDGVWPDGLNKNFVRLLLNQGSKVENFDPISGNFEQFYNQAYKDGQKYWTSDESGKTVLNFWLNTKPQETSEANISYAPNYTVATNGDFTYRVLLQRQPGAPADHVNLSVKFPENFVPEDTKYDVRESTVDLSFDVTKDTEVVIKFRKKRMVDL